MRREPARSRRVRKGKDMTKKRENGKLFPELKQATSLRVLKHLELDFKEKNSQLSKLSKKQAALAGEADQLEELIYDLKAKIK